MISQGVPWASLAPYMTDYFIFGGMIIGALVLGATPLRAPFQWMETYYHELSHGLASLLTFGRFKKIKLNWNGSGYAITAGGSRLLILLAGYMGAALWGGYLYLAGWLSTGTGASQLLSFELLFLGIATVMWVRDLVTLVIVASMAAVFGLPLLIPNIPYLPYFIQFIGIYVVLNAIRAPLHLIDGKHVGDGAALQDLTKIIPEILWVLWWFCFAIAVLVGCAILTLPGMKLVVGWF